MPREDVRTRLVPNPQGVAKTACNRQRYALAFALSRPEASSVIVGVNTAAELQAVIAAASSAPPDLDWDGMAMADPTDLDPQRWHAA